MDRVSTIAAALAVVAVTVLGCGQVPAAEPTSASSTGTPAPATSTAFAPSVTDTSQDADAAQPPVPFTGRIVCGDIVRTGVSESPADGGPVRWHWDMAHREQGGRLAGLIHEHQIPG